MKRTCFQKSAKTNENMACELHTTFKKRNYIQMK